MKLPDSVKKTLHIWFEKNISDKAAALAFFLVISRSRPEVWWKLSSTVRVVEYQAASR